MMIWIVSCYFDEFKFPDDDDDDDEKLENCSTFTHFLLLLLFHIRKLNK